MHRLGCRRRRGRLKILPHNGERKVCLRRFLLEMAGAPVEGERDIAIIFYVGVCFVHKCHGSAYSYFDTYDGEVVQDGIGRTTTAITPR